MNRNITRSMLLDSLVFGKPIDLYVNGPTNLWTLIYDARVSGLALESGSCRGEAARHYIVTLESEGRTYRAYVHTID